MNHLLIPCRPGAVSDGYHTFDELYMHRAALFLALMAAHPTISWFSKLHDDGTMFPGMFIAGIQLPTGDITYHLMINMWEHALRTGAKELEKGPKWDGHTPDDVVQRLLGSYNRMSTEVTQESTKKDKPEFLVAMVGKSVVVENEIGRYITAFPEGGTIAYTTRWMREATLFTYDKTLWEKLHKGMSVIEVDPTL